MGDLRERIELDLRTTLEGRFGLPVELTSPAGVTQIYSKNDPELLLQGQVMYDTTEFNPETGERVVIPEPVVTLRRSSLDTIPQPGEFWFITIPSKPGESAPKETYVLSTDLPPQDGRSLGIVRLYLTKPKQS
jgi:hypothetical protein